MLPFQSPIRRGSRCNLRADGERKAPHCFSPLFVGAGVAIYEDAYPSRAVCAVSVPYSSGQALQSEWLLLVPKADEFQSPICRGRRCNMNGIFPIWNRNRVSVPYSSGQALQSCASCWKTCVRLTFQSPIRRGRRCNTRENAWRSAEAVSVPYSSGQALQSAGGGVESVSVTVSVPYLSGQALQLDSTLCPNFVSTFCQGARQPTA